MFGKSDKIIVGLAITHSLGLEVCVYDRNSMEVTKYGQRFVEYNMATKTADMNSFRSELADLLNELGLQKNAINAYLVLPNVYFGFKSFDDPNTEKALIEELIAKDASGSYIFKQEEPVSAWVDMNELTGAAGKYIAYTSFQGRAIDTIQDAFMDLGIAIIGVESSASAIPRAIGMSGLCSDAIQINTNWNILQVNSNGYIIIQMCGERMLDYIEVPFAIMSFEGDEIYSALSSAAAQYLSNYPAKKLVIYSLTDNVSAKALKNEIAFDNEIVTIDANNYATDPVVSISPDILTQKTAGMSMNVLGAASPKFEGFKTLNILGNISYDGIIEYGVLEIGDHQFSLASDIVRKFSICLSIAVAVLAVILVIGLIVAHGVVVIRTEDTEDRITQLKTEIEDLQSKLGGRVTPLIRQIMNNNKQAINYYDSLSTDIPSYVWLTYYINKDGKSVGIEGYSLEIASIYDYYNNLKVLTPQSDVKLNKLEVFGDEGKNKNTDADSLVLESGNSQKIFSFEISNTTYQKAFDIGGNRIKVAAPAAPQQKEQAAPQTQKGTRDEGISNFLKSLVGKDNKESPSEATRSYAASIPDVPDVEINLKEIE